MKTSSLATLLAAALFAGAAEKSFDPLAEALQLNKISPQEFQKFAEREFAEPMVHYKELVAAGRKEEAAEIAGRMVMVFANKRDGMPDSPEFRRGMQGNPFARLDEQRRKLEAADRELRELAEKTRNTSDAGEREKMTAELRKKIEAFVDQRLSLGKQQIEATRRQLENLQQEMDEMSRNKAEFIERRLRDITGQ